MTLLHRGTGYKWKFVSILNDTITLRNEYEDREVSVLKADIWSQYKRPVRLDRNGFKMNANIKGWN